MKQYMRAVKKQLLKAKEVLRAQVLNVGPLVVTVPERISIAFAQSHVTCGI
jgi:hypothetical protein